MIVEAGGRFVGAFGKRVVGCILVNIVIQSMKKDV